jgi:phytoene dehydrogenase-like protein
MTTSIPSPGAPDDPTDAIVVGGGPNGLTAAIRLARAGHAVTVFEGRSTVGGGTRTADLTLPGFRHDVCSAIHPFGRISPAFREIGLERRGVRWVEPPAPLGHPLDDGTAVMLSRDVDATAATLGSDADAKAYRALMGSLVAGWDALQGDILAPFHVPLRPLRALGLARFGLTAIGSAIRLGRRFEGVRARALIGGAAAHSQISLTEPISAASALVMLTTAHVDGWPFPAGGSMAIADALAAEFSALGGVIATDRSISRVEDLPSHRVGLFDVTPRQLLAITGDRFQGRYRRALEHYRYGPGVFKLDLAIDGPIPWQASELLAAGTVHLGGTLEEIAQSEALVAHGRVPDQPFVLLAQQSLFDPSRAPAGQHTVWAYCHVPNGSDADMTEPILSQIERFAPGFRDRILAAATTTPTTLEAYDPNDVGGDITGGRMDLRQLFTRPAVRLDPYSTPDPAIYLCSASTPPGGGVHGMCGDLAARSAARRLA